MAESIKLTSIPFNFTYFEAHPGKVFTGIITGRFKLKLEKVKTHVAYLEKITPTGFDFSWNGVTNSRSYLSEITEASFTIITSRTSPLEPQPVIGAQ